MKLRSRFLHMLLLGRDTPLPKRRKRTPKKTRKERGLEIEAALDAWAEDRANMRRDFSRTEVAKEIGVSTAELSDYFQLILSKDFRTWKTEVRIRWAMHMMETDENTSIHEVCKRLGFADESNFHRQFKRMTGTTPARWRGRAGLRDS